MRARVLNQSEGDVNDVAKIHVRFGVEEAV